LADIRDLLAIDSTILVIGSMSKVDNSTPNTSRGEKCL